MYVVFSGFFFCRPSGPRYQPTHCLCLMAHGLSTIYIYALCACAGCAAAAAPITHRASRSSTQEAGTWFICSAAYYLVSRGSPRSDLFWSDLPRSPPLSYSWRTPSPCSPPLCCSWQGSSLRLPTPVVSQAIPVASKLIRVRVSRGCYY
jgi:hypothetical protein